MDAHIISAPNEYRLNPAPVDCISRVRFAKDNPKFLLVSSWDGIVRLYEVNSNELRVNYQHDAPVLDCTFIDGGRCVSGSMDKNIKLFDTNTSQEQTIGTHDDAVRCTEFNHESGMLFTGSWDSTVKLWDVRMPRFICSANQPDKVYTMSVCGDKLIVGTAGRKVYIWDARKLSSPEQKRDSSLKYQTRCISAFPNRQGYALSSIEGRVAVEFVDPSPEAQKKKYAFKCHRQRNDQSGQEYIYPVNALTFHPFHNTFASGGSDGFVNIWDPFNKKRLCQLHKYPTSVSSLSFSCDGSVLAIAVSYQFETPDETSAVQEDNIFIRKVTDQETKPKS